MPERARSAWSKASLAIVGIAAALALCEGAMQVAFRIRHGHWVAGDASRVGEFRDLFEFHPYLAAVPRPGASRVIRNGVTISIRDDGTRSLGDAESVPRAGVPAVYCLGGSSTFCVGVTDGDTWPAVLQRLLGAGARVSNLGVPGYSTAEAVIQTTLRVPAAPRAVCVYYEGLNDARNMNLVGLRPDYSDFHGPSQLENLQVIPPVQGFEPFLLLRAWRRFATRTGVREDPYAAFRPRTIADRSFVDKVDAAALDLFRRNLRTLAAVCRDRGAESVFVPQVMCFARLTGDGSYGWAPRVRDSFWREALGAYHAAMRDLCRERGVDYVGEVLDRDWADADFIDEAHLSRGGAAAFADVVAPHVAAALSRIR